MNKWAVRILGIFIILAFVLMMMNLEKQLVMMQRSRQGSSAPSR